MCLVKYIVGQKLSLFCTYFFLLLFLLCLVINSTFNTLLKVRFIMDGLLNLHLVIALVYSYLNYQAYSMKDTLSILFIVDLHGTEIIEIRSIKVLF